MERPADNRRIVFLQSDHLMYESCASALSGVRALQLERIPTAIDFLRRLEDFKGTPPRVFVADVRLRGMDPASVMPELPDYLRAGTQDRPNTVGLRCLKMLLDEPATRSMHQVLFSDLGSYDKAEDMAKGVGLPGIGHLFYVDYSILEYPFEALAQVIESLTGP